MTFSEQLNEYIDLLSCTARELADESGLSGGVISRYRSGERVPEADGIQLEKLARGISKLSRNPPLAFPDVYSALRADLSDGRAEGGHIAENINALITLLDINATKLARFLNFDSSYLSRIRSGKRRPADAKAFEEGVSRYIVTRCTKDAEKAAVADLTGIEPERLENEASYFKLLADWIYEGIADTYDYLGDFLKKLDDFDLDEYIRAVRFDELKVPSPPFHLPSSKNYYGTEEMKKGELDFFKATLLSKSTEPIFMCSDMPMADMAEDIDFGKKWMYATAASLKKGLHLDMVHNVDRPFNEMMLGLMSWIPIYMTGQVSPYYLKGRQNDVYCHFNYVSGSAALTGECISGYHDNGKYYLTNSKDEVAYYRRKACDLLSKATPLMEIYLKNSEKKYRAFLNADSLAQGARRNILSSLPIYTMPAEMLEEILTRNSVCGEELSRLLDYAEAQRQSAENILKHSAVCDEATELSKEEFEKYPAALSLSGAFYEKEIIYSYEEYMRHLSAGCEYAQRHENYTFKLSKGQAFRNIRITIHEGEWAMISKNKAPVIHFVIRHPKMLRALENFIVPVDEAQYI